MSQRPSQDLKDLIKQVKQLNTEKEQQRHITRPSAQGIITPDKRMTQMNFSPEKRLIQSSQHKAPVTPSPSQAYSSKKIKFTPGHEEIDLDADILDQNRYQKYEISKLKTMVKDLEQQKEDQSEQISQLKEMIIKNSSQSMIKIGKTSETLETQIDMNEKFREEISTQLGNLQAEFRTLGLSAKTPSSEDSQLQHIKQETMLAQLKSQFQNQIRDQFMTEVEKRESMEESIKNINYISTSNRNSCRQLQDALSNDIQERDALYQSLAEKVESIQDTIEHKILNEKFTQNIDEKIKSEIKVNIEEREAQHFTLLSEQEQHFNDIKEKLSQIQKQYDEIKYKSSSMERIQEQQHVDLESKISKSQQEFNKQLKLNQKSISVMTQDLIQVEEQIKNINEKYDQLSCNSKDQQQQYDTPKYTEVQQSNKQFGELLVELQGKIVQVTKQQNQAAFEEQETQTQIKKINQIIQQLSHQVQKTEQESTKKQKEQEQKLNDQEKHIQELQQSMAHLSTEIFSMRKQQEDNESVLENKVQSVMRQSNEHPVSSEQSNRIQQLESQFAIIQDSIEQQQKELHQMAENMEYANPLEKSSLWHQYLEQNENHYNLLQDTILKLEYHS